MVDPLVIAQALGRAEKLVKSGVKLDKALAECTVTSQCDGVPGFKVFAGVREAVLGVLPKSVSYATFCDTASTQKVLSVLEAARLVVAS